MGFRLFGNGNGKGSSSNGKGPVRRRRDRRHHERSLEGLYKLLLGIVATGFSH
jgi:hypothetical protein